MQTFHFYSSISGINLGTYNAESKKDAIDQFVKDCGFSSWEELLKKSPGAADDDLVIATDE